MLMHFGNGRAAARWSRRMECIQVQSQRDEGGADSLKTQMWPLCFLLCRGTSSDSRLRLSTSPGCGCWPSNAIPLCVGGQPSNWAELRVRDLQTTTLQSCPRNPALQNVSTGRVHIHIFAFQIRPMEPLIKLRLRVSTLDTPKIL